MKMKAIETKYGIIHGRNALILSGSELNFKPLKLTINASLSLSACRPEVLNKPDIGITFKFNDIENLSIYRVDDYPNEKYTESSFDEVFGTYKKNRKRIILSTYDYIFDVTGHYEIVY